MNSLWPLLLCASVSFGNSDNDNTFTWYSVGAGTRAWLAVSDIGTNMRPRLILLWIEISSSDHPSPKSEASSRRMSKSRHFLLGPCFILKLLDSLHYSLHKFRICFNIKISFSTLKTKLTAHCPCFIMARQTLSMLSWTGYHLRPSLVQVHCEALFHFMTSWTSHHRHHVDKLNNFPTSLSDPLSLLAKLTSLCL